MRKKIVSVGLAITCAFTMLTATGCNSEKKEEKVKETEANVNTNETEGETDGKNYDFGLADSTKEGAILHAFSWSFATIKESMADIASAGYTSIQTSPINECYDGDNGMQLYGDGKWYYHYQPTDYKIGNYQLGTRDEFIAMCKEADKYGIKIIVDVAANHTTTHTECISEDFINAVGGFDKLFHKNGLQTMTQVSDRLNGTTYSLGGLPDLDTENTDYQKYMLNYLNDCIACGADGFRFDAARHIGLSDDPGEDGKTCDFWDVVLGGLDNKDNLFNYGETLQGQNDRIGAYIDKIGAATASTYGKRIRYYVGLDNIRAEDISDYYSEGSSDVVVWVESHDNYINDGTSQEMDDTDITLAWAIIASRSTGTPLFFDRPYGADKDSVWGNLNEIGAAGSPLYKSATISAVNHFRNAMIGEEEKLANPEDNAKVLLIERGTKGLVIVNIGEEYNIQMQTSLADGTYVNRADGTTEYVVQDGMIRGNIPEKSVVVLYNEGYLDIETMPEVWADAKEYYAMTVDKEDVTLHVSGSDQGSYILGDGDETVYTDGTVISIGDTLKEGESVKLTVKAKNKVGFISAMSYTFTKAAKEEKTSIENGITVYFQKPSDWKDELFAYIYDPSADQLKILKDWPGDKMVDEGKGLYSYTFEADWNTGLIMFSDGTNQYPASNESGLAIEDKKKYSKE